MNHLTRRTILAAAPAALALSGPILGAWPARAAQAKKQYGPGVTDTEIKIGNTGPYSGPAVERRPASTVHGRLLQDDQRKGRHQRPQDHLYLL